jgi:5'-deoxynucleotidase YfbR-like HD superfamily hydrolase
MAYLSKINDVQKNLAGFPPEREEALRRIERFSMFDVFFYRSTLWHHELRVFLIVSELSPLIRELLPSCDIEKTRILALVHDDAEIITGDVQLGHKQMMTDAELRNIVANEADAIEQLAKRYPPTIGVYSYKELLMHALLKDCIEAQVVSYADKLDAYCESLHELFGGNLSLLRATLNYSNLLSRFSEKFPLLRPLLADPRSPLVNLDLRLDPMHVYRRHYQHVNKPHSRESLQQEVDLPVYATWRRIVMDGLGTEGVEILTTQKERF